MHFLLFISIFSAFIRLPFLFCPTFAWAKCPKNALKMLILFYCFPAHFFSNFFYYFPFYEVKAEIMALVGICKRWNNHISLFILLFFSHSRRKSDFDGGEGDQGAGYMYYTLIWQKYTRTQFDNIKRFSFCTKIFFPFVLPLFPGIFALQLSVWQFIFSSPICFLLQLAPICFLSTSLFRFYSIRFNFFSLGCSFVLLFMHITGRIWVSFQFGWARYRKKHNKQWLWHWHTPIRNSLMQFLLWNIIGEYQKRMRFTFFPICCCRSSRP